MSRMLRVCWYGRRRGDLDHIWKRRGYAANMRREGEVLLETAMSV